MGWNRAPRAAGVALAVVLLAATSSMSINTALAQQSAQRQFSFDLPSKPVPQAVNDIGRITGLSVVFPENRPIAATSRPVRGSMTAGEALAALLSGTGLSYRFSNATTVMIVDPSAQAGAAGGASVPGAIALDTINVQGGANPNSTMTLMPTYAGGQVARGGQVGMLGNRDVMDTPFNQTIYTSEFIRNQSASTVGDALDNEPSLRRISSSSGSAGSSYDYFSMRGFNVLSSDVAINGLYGLVPWYGAIPAEFVERVEVLKGASALLSGMSPNGALGGAINLVPKHATDQPITRGTVGFDSDALWTVQGDVGRRFGSNGEWGVRVNGSYKRGDTYVDGQSRERLFGSFGLDYRGERLRLALDAYAFQENNWGGDVAGIWMTGRTSVLKPPRGSNNYTPGLDWKAQTAAVMLSSEYDINEHVTAFAKIGANTYSRDGYYNNALSNVQDNGDATVSVTRNPQRRNNVSGEFGLRGQFQTAFIDHALTISASQLTSSVSQISTNANNLTNIYNPLPITVWPAATDTIPKSSDSTLRGIAFADTMSVAEGRVQLTLGVRRQSVESRSYNTSGTVTSRYDESAWTPMAGIVVKPLNNLSLYANYMEGLSQGTVVPTTYQNSGEVLSPYKTKQIEIGAKLETGTFINTLSLFQMTKPSTTTHSATNALPTLSLDGEQQNRGIEWTIFGELTPGLRILGGATYLHGQLTKTQDHLYDGNEAPAAPRFTANMGLDWDVPGVPGLAVNGRIIYTSSQYIDNANKLKLPDWTRIDVGARYATGQGVVFRAGIKNLFDRNYWQTGFLPNIATPGAPRTYWLSASMDF